MSLLILRYFVSCPFVTDTVNVVYEKYYHRERTRATILHGIALELNTKIHAK